MTNNNSLRGIQCPDCKSDGPFVVTIVTTAVVYDDGIDKVDSDFERGDLSPISCLSCRRHSIVSEFRSNNP